MHEATYGRGKRGKRVRSRALLTLFIGMHVATYGRYTRDTHVHVATHGRGSGARVLLVTVTLARVRLVSGARVLLLTVTLARVLLLT